MSSTKPFVASWGIIGTGWIANKFVTDLSVQSEDFTDVLHSIAAVGSRTKSRADEFIKANCPNGAVAQQEGLSSKPPQACGSYEEVFNHKDVNIIYIATLHPSHYVDAKAALEAGKHCLIEKPATLNAAEWRDLSALATNKKLFLMEGMWTRFQPIIAKLQKALFDDKVIGDIRGVNGTFAMNHDNTPSDHRLLAPSAAGGALLDLGAYSILPIILALYHNPANNKTPPAQIQSTMVRGPTGVDLTTSITMTFPKIKAFGVGIASFAMHSPKDQRCIISGTKGEIILHDLLCRLEKFTIRRVSNSEMIPGFADDILVEAPLLGFGLVYEANDVARSIRDGLLQSKTMPHEETGMVMELFDLVRKQNDYELEEGLEQIK